MDLVKKMPGIIVKHYNFITGKEVDKLEEIPNEVLELYAFMDHSTIAKPLMLLELNHKGTPLEMLAEKYALTYKQCYYWAKNFGVPLPTYKK